MRAHLVGLALLALAALPATAQPADPHAIPPCRSANDCPLIPFVQARAAPMLEGVTLSPGGAAGLLVGRTADPALPLFRLILIDQNPPLPNDAAAATFMQGLSQPGRMCTRRLIAENRRGAAFDLKCEGGQTPAIQAVLFTGPYEGRTRVMVAMAPLANGPALLARSQRLVASAFQTAQAAPAPATPARDYAQLRADCANDTDAMRQIAGCNAVLANPGESNNYAIAYNNRGHAEERRGNLPAAVADYDRALARDPRYAVAHVNRGRALGLMDRYDEALAAIDRSLAIEANLWARLERARIHARRRDETRAAAELDQIIAADAKFADALIDRARLRARLGDHRRALEDFEAALAAEPNNPAAKEGRDMARAMLAANPTPPAAAAPPPPAAAAPAGQPDLSRFMDRPQRAEAAPAAAAQGAAPQGAAQPPTMAIETVRGLMRDEPFSLSYPAELKQEPASGSAVYLNHPDAHFQVTLYITKPEGPTSAEAAARVPTDKIMEDARAVFQNVTLDYRTLVTLPAGPAHLYVQSMTSTFGDRPRLRAITAEVFSEGRHYILYFAMRDTEFEARRGAIAFILANFSPSSAPRACCLAPVQLPW